MKPVQIDLIAFIPEGWDLCTTCAAFMAEAGLNENKAERSLEAFPPEWQADFTRLSDFILELSQRYRDRIRLKIYDPRSIQGMGKAIRHGIRSYPAFVIGNKKKVMGLDHALLAEFLRGEGISPYEGGSPYHD